MTINHRRVGNGPIYLGTYHFEDGTAGSVVISNRSNDAGRVVIADMIRFGNGVGDVVQGGTTSGRDREDEAGLYWVEWHVTRSQGIPESEYRTSSDDRSATVSLSPRYAEYMNRESDGALSDRVFISFHSNAGGGSARGVLSLYNGNNNPSTATPNQFLLANLTGREVNDDLVAQAGMFEHNWHDRGSSVTLDRSDIEFGEINNLRINNEFDATIVETGFHDNQQDAEMLRDAKVRDALARATYQGAVKYFNNVDGGSTSLTMLPGRVDGVVAEAAGEGSVTVSWSPPAANSYNGDAATGYRIYGSTNGYGFDGGTFVAGGATVTHTLTGLDPGQGPYYFKVAAVNSGGEGVASEVVAATPTAGQADVLIVNGFDRLGRTQNPEQSGAQRVRPRQSNSFDYAVQVASAIEATAPTVSVDTASNEAVISGDVDLDDYQAVIWILGEESSADDTFNATEQTLAANYLAAGGKLFVSGAEIAWDLDNLNNGRAFYENQLRADYVADDANAYDVAGTAGSIFDGLSFSFDDGAQFYDAEFADVINPTAGAETALTYSTGGGAGIVFDGGAGGPKVVNFGFPYETITDAVAREQVMAAVLQFFDLDATVSEVTYILDNNSLAPEYVESGIWATSTATGFNGGTYRFAATGTPATASWNFDAAFDGQGEVFVWYVQGSNRASSAEYQITTAGGTETIAINQKTAGETWVSLGTFDFAAGPAAISLNAENSSGGSVVIADAVRVVLAAASEPAADFNQDGVTSGRDFLRWQQGFGSGTTLADGDSDADGDVDGDDLDAWQAQFGQIAAGAVASASAASGLYNERILRAEDLATLADSRIRGAGKNEASEVFEQAIDAAILQSYRHEPRDVAPRQPTASDSAPPAGHTTSPSNKALPFLPLSRLVRRELI